MSSWTRSAADVAMSRAVGPFAVAQGVGVLILPHFCPPTFSPIFKNGSFLSIVALVSVTLLDLNPLPPPQKKDRFWHRLPPHRPADYDN